MSSNSERSADAGESISVDAVADEEGAEMSASAQMVFGLATELKTMFAELPRMISSSIVGALQTNKVKEVPNKTNTHTYG